MSNNKSFFAVLAWHLCGKTISDRVEHVQNYAVCVILKKPPRTSTETLRKLDYTATKVPWSTKYTIVFKSRLHPYLCSKFIITNFEFGYRGTRGANKVHLLRRNTSFEVLSRNTVL